MKKLTHLQRLALRDAGKLDDRHETIKAGGEHLKTTLESLARRGLLQRRGLAVPAGVRNHRGWMTYVLTEAGKTELLSEHWGEEQ